MVTTLTHPLPLLKWDVARYHEAARLGLLGDLRVELLDGDIVVVPVPEPIHEWLIRQIIKRFRETLGDTAWIEKGQPISLSETSEPVPDIVVAQPRDDDYKYNHPQPEAIYLVIEIANSAPERDTNLKRQLYAQAGIQEYWVFDIGNQVLRVFRDIQPRDGAMDYQIDQVWADDTISMRALPDLTFNAQTLRSLME